MRPRRLDRLTRSLSVLGPLPQGDGSVGGVGLYNALLLEAVASASTREVRALAQRSRTISWVRPPGNRVRLMPAWEPGPFALQHVAPMLRSSRLPGILHVHYEAVLYGSTLVSLELPLFLRRLRSRGWRTVVTLHHFLGPDVDVEQLRFWKRAQIADALHLRALRWIQEALINSSDRVIVHEPRVASMIPAGARVSMIPHMSVRRDPRPRGRETRPSRKTAVLVFFGFLAPNKGLEKLFKAMRILEARGVPVRLEVVGGLHPRLVRDNSYVQFINGLKDLAAGAHSITLRGYLALPEVDEILENADGFIFPYEAVIGSSGALAYAAAFGRQVLVSQALSDFMGLGSEGWVRSFDLTEEAIAACVRIWATEGSTPIDGLPRWLEMRAPERIGALHEHVYQRMDSVSD